MTLSGRTWSERRRGAFTAWRGRRFWSRVDQSAGADACWPWTGPRTWNGYGKASLDDRTQNAHRVAWVLTHGSISSGLHVDHLCRVKLCCNPAHLEPVSVRENLSRSPTFNGKRTHCPQGHPYSGKNLRYYPQRPRNGRMCATCQNARAVITVRKWRARKRAERNA